MMYTKSLLSWWLVLVAGVLLAGCSNKSKSNVPDAMVRVSVEFPMEYKGKQIAPYELCTSVAIKEKRYASDVLGYAGIVIWCNAHSEYMAADLCCPKCVKRDTPIDVDGMDAVCPLCGEHYLLIDYGGPSVDKSNQPLKRYGVRCTQSLLGVKVSVYNN